MTRQHQDTRTSGLRTPGRAGARVQGHGARVQGHRARVQGHCPRHTVLGTPSCCSPPSQYYPPYMSRLTVLTVSPRTGGTAMSQGERTARESGRPDPSILARSINPGLAQSINLARSINPGLAQSIKSAIFEPQFSLNPRSNLKLNQTARSNARMAE